MRVDVNLRFDQIEGLERVSETTDKPVSQLIRDAIDLYISTIPQLRALTRDEVDMEMARLSRAPESNCRNDRGCGD
jgi:hypothetical protein